MLIGDRIRVIREAKSLSQGDIEKRAGLLRAYISRIENGHTVPAVETLEKFARALEVPYASRPHQPIRPELAAPHGAEDGLFVGNPNELVGPTT